MLYYRFSEENFLQDQIWAFKAEIFGGKNLIGIDLLPQDVCPNLYDLKKFLEMGQDFKETL